MIKDYEIEDNKCVVCGNESNKPLCASCYNSYRRFYNEGENLSYCNKNIRYAMLKLFAHFDLLEDDGVDGDKTGFLIDFAQMIRPLVEDEYYLNESEDKLIIKELQLENKKLREQLQNNNDSENDENSDPRKKWPAKYRCRDGHYVRSRAELLIDNWLFAEGVKHIYEKQVTFPNNDKCLCDFYLPDLSAYIEFWGKTDDYYVKRKNIKTSLYKTLKNVKLIELDDKSLENLDDILDDYISNLR